MGHPNIVRAFEQGLANTIATMIEGLPSYDRIQVYLGSNRLRSSHTSAHESVGQWRDPLGASRQILDNISRLLNSNENFEPDDSLQLDITHISMPKPGRGKPKGSRKRWCFGTDNYGELLKNKRSVFRIKNKDDLCCARALVVGKAMADGDAQTKLIKNHQRTLQETLAHQLQEEARVPPGPCGLEQIKLFEIVLCDYQLVVVSAEHEHAIVHKGPPSEKQIFLLMHDGHFDVITSLPGFFNTVYFCLECEKGYFTEDYMHHHCNKTKCNACYQMKCSDYDLLKHIEKPELFCRDSHRHFYDPTCKDNHLSRKANGQLVGPSERNVCRSHKKCSVCFICTLRRPRNMPNIVDSSIVTIVRRRSTCCSIDVIFNVLMRRMKIMKRFLFTLTLKPDRTLVIMSPICFALRLVWTIPSTRSRGNTVSLNS